MTARDESLFRTASLTVESLVSSFSLSGDVSNDARRDIFWEATTIMLGEPNPELEIDASGTIVKKVNVNLQGGYGLGDTIPAGDIVVLDIDYDQPSTVTFHANEPGSGAPAGHIFGNAGLFQLQHTWDYVRITNRSNRRLITNLIDVVDGGTTIDIRVTSRPGPVDSPANGTSLSETPPGATIEFDLDHTFPETEVAIQNLNTGVADSDIVIDGNIENPIGTTIINNVRGNIFSGTD